MIPDRQELAADLERRLSGQLRQEASRSGFDVEPDWIPQAVRAILGSGGKEGLPGVAPDSDSEEIETREYLHRISQEVRKEGGQYTTPLPIARYILRAVGYRPEEETLERTVCDPACGTGVFLVEAARVFLRALEKAGVPRPEWYPRVGERFVGFDVDPLACLHARFHLGQLLASPLLSWMAAQPERLLPPPFRIHQRDTLTALAGELGGGELWTSEDRPQPLVEAFDVVVGNPPYKKLGRIPGLLKQAFSGSIFGHPNAYGLFLHAGLEMLKPGGRLGFIVPRSMLSGLYFQELRKLIEARVHPEELTLLADRKGSFPEVLQGTMIFVFRKPLLAEASEAASRPVRTGVARSVADLEEGPPHTRVEASRVMRRLNGMPVWFVADQARTYLVLDKLLGRHPLLGSPGVSCPARTGPVVWNRVRPHLRSQGGPGNVPLIWATDVGRFRFEPGSAERRPAYLAETPETRGLATMGASLLVQRVTADEQARRIVATVAAPKTRRYFVENHLNVLQPVSGSPAIDLYYLLGLLSSDVVELLFRVMNGNTQVSATELNLLPIPRGAFEPEIAALAEGLEDAVRSGASLDNLEGELNERVALAYGLTGNELAFIRRSLRENAEPLKARRESGEAERIKGLLQELGFPAKHATSRTALTVLALSDKRSRKGLLSGHSCLADGARIHDILNFVRWDCGRPVAENTRETYRKDSIRPLLEVGWVERHQLSTNDPYTYYLLDRKLARLLETEPGLERNLLMDQLRLPDRRRVSRQRRKEEAVEVRVRVDRTFLLSRGEHNELEKAVVEELAPKVFDGRWHVLYVGDTAPREGFKDDLWLRRLNLPIDVTSSLPDVVAYDPKRELLLIAEVVTSSGPITPARLAQLHELTRRVGAETRVAYLTAFPTGKVFHQFRKDLSLRTNVWIREEPEGLLPLADLGRPDFWSWEGALVVDQSSPYRKVVAAGTRGLGEGRRLRG